VEELILKVHPVLELCDVLEKGRDSSFGMSTRYWLDGARRQDPGVDEIFHTRPDLTWGPGSLLHNGSRIFWGGEVKQGPWRGVNHPPPI
jgi:hypothetical protein